jgi:type II secretory pathway component PulM
MSGILILIVLYNFIFSTLLSNSEQLQADIKTEYELTLYLDQARQKISTLVKHQDLSKEQAKQTITNTFQAQSIQFNALMMQEKSATINVSRASFNQLLSLLQQLKDDYGITVNKANIERIETGIVSAQLNFQFP